MHTLEMGSRGRGRTVEWHTRGQDLALPSSRLRRKRQAFVPRLPGRTGRVRARGAVQALVHVSGPPCARRFVKDDISGQWIASCIIDRRVDELGGRRRGEEYHEREHELEDEGIG